MATFSTTSCPWLYLLQILICARLPLYFTLISNWWRAVNITYRGPCVPLLPSWQKGAEDGGANEAGRADGGTDKQRNRHDGSRWEGRIGGAHKMGADGQRAAGGGAGGVRQPGRPGHPLPSTPH